MKMTIRIEDGDEVTEEVALLSEVQAAELRLLREVGLHFLMQKIPPQDYVALASIIPGLVSIGSDAVMKKWGETQLKRQLIRIEY